MRWAWLALHVLGFAACAVFGPPIAFIPYLAAFLTAEVLGLLTGHPMTRYVREWIASTRSRPVAGSVAAVTVTGWVAGFVILCVGHGPFTPPLNAFVAILPLAGWLVPHFYVDRW